MNHLPVEGTSFEGAPERSMFIGGDGTVDGQTPHRTNGLSSIHDLGPTWATQKI